MIVHIYDPLEESQPGEAAVAVALLYAKVAN